jgi:hypothetical protein
VRTDRAPSLLAGRSTIRPEHGFRNQAAHTLLSACAAGWINESMKVQETDPNYYGTVNYHHHLVHTIHHDLFDIPYDSNRTMAPSWYVHIRFEVRGPLA